MLESEVQAKGVIATQVERRKAEAFNICRDGVDEAFR
jgi:hypothetical protein